MNRLLRKDETSTASVRRFRTALLMLITLFLLLGRWTPTLQVAWGSRSQPPDLEIRVLLVEGLTQLSVRGLDLRVLDAETRLEYPSSGSTAILGATSSGMTLDGALLPQSKVVLESPAVFLKVNEREYRSPLVVRYEGRTLMVIGHLFLEKYLEGTVAGEMPSYWPMEALKAQAVVSRSFAWVQLRRSGRAPFDVVADVRHQVYAGADADTARVVRAVKLTRGVVLARNKRPVEAFFHSTCGGSTEAAVNVWPKASRDLGSVPCGYCNISPAFEWTLRMSPDDLARKLQNLGFSASRVDSIEVTSRSKSGRALKLHFSGGEHQLDLDCNSLRGLVGYSKLKSCRFAVRELGGRIVFQGQGYGHGVGMCQWGARGMALKGMTAEQILDHYYPGTERLRLAIKKPPRHGIISGAASPEMREE